MSEEGNTIYFDTTEEAEKYAKENLHESMYRIIDVPVNFVI
jgi:hypothetical protein